MRDTPVMVSYYLKKPITCMVCRAEFRKEEMLTGGGRLIAKESRDDLRRIYEPSRKAGEVFPLIYPVAVCPFCLYSAYMEDFTHLRDDSAPTALSQSEKRRRDIGLIFPIVDFKKPRTLISGAASYILAISCYSFHTKERAPIFKKAVSALRAAWVFDDLNTRYPGQNYDRIRMIMYRKAMKYYEQTVAYAQSGRERVDSVRHFGPDLDKNYGFDGVLFLSSLLVYKYDRGHNREERIAKLQSAKRLLSKNFGLGKPSKSKPSFILELIKDLYKKINIELSELMRE